MEEDGTWIEEGDNLRKENVSEMEEGVRNPPKLEEVTGKSYTGTGEDNKEERIVIKRIKEIEARGKSCQGTGSSWSSIGVRAEVNQEARNHDRQEEQEKSSEEDQKSGMSGRSENLRKRSLGGGEGREEWMQMDKLDGEGVRVGELNVKHGQMGTLMAASLKLQDSGTFIKQENTNIITTGVQRLVKKFECLGGGRGKEEGYALHCLETHKKVFEFAGSKDCSPSKKIRLAKPDYCKLALSPATPSKASQAGLLDPWTTPGDRSVLAGTSGSPGQHLRARERLRSSHFRGGGSSSGRMGSRGSTRTGTVSRWPPTASCSASRSSGSTSNIGEQPDHSKSSQTPGTGRASTGHTRGTCCPASRATQPSNVSVMARNHLQQFRLSSSSLSSSRQASSIRHDHLCLHLHRLVHHLHRLQQQNH